MTSTTTYHHPAVSGSIPAEAIAEVRTAVAAVDAFEREVCTSAELVQFAAEDVAGTWGNIDPQALAAAVEA